MLILVNKREVIFLYQIGNITLYGLFFTKCMPSIKLLFLRYTCCLESHLQRDSSPKTAYKAQHLEILSKHFWKYYDKKTFNSKRTVWSFTAESRVWYEQDFTVAGLDFLVSQMLHPGYTTRTPVIMSLTLMMHACTEKLWNLLGIQQNHSSLKSLLTY